MRSMIIDSPSKPSEIGSVLAEHFTAPTRCEAVEVLDVLEPGAFDALFLDQTRIDHDAVALCARIRQNHQTLPIMLINEMVPSHEIVRGLMHGADDYVVKPMPSRELVARVRALLRRNRFGVVDRLRYGDLELDLRAWVASRGDHTAELTSCEFSLLHLLMQHQEEVVSRATISEAIWGIGRAPASNSIEAHVCSLRKKVDRPGMQRLIMTVPRRGYRIGPASTAPRVAQPSGVNARALAS